MASTLSTTPYSAKAAPEAKKRAVTAEDYFAMPDDSPRCELIDGELRMVPSPDYEHQEIGFALAVMLRLHVAERYLGKVAVAPLDIQLSSSVVVQPDILLLPPDHPQVKTGKGRITVPPSLVIEVLSPSSIRTDRNDKFRLYQQAKIPHYWIVDPAARRIEAWVLVDGQYDLQVVTHAPDTFTAPPFDDLAIDLTQVFGESRAE